METEITYEIMTDATRAEVSTLLQKFGFSPVKSGGADTLGIFQKEKLLVSAVENFSRKSYDSWALKESFYVESLQTRISADLLTYGILGIRIRPSQKENLLDVLASEMNDIRQVLLGAGARVHFYCIQEKKDKNTERFVWRRIISF